MILQRCNLSPLNTNAYLSPSFPFTPTKPRNPNFRLLSKPSSFKPHFINRRNLPTLNSSIQSNNDKPSLPQQNDSANQRNLVEVCNPNFPPFVPSWAPKFSRSDQAFFLLTFITCTTSAALVSFVAAAVPTLHAMGRAANSLSKLADAAQEELPGTMAAVRLSGMEISDLTLELSDLSQEISEGVNKSVQAVQAAENGIRHIGTLARKQTASLIQERASLPVINLQPVVAGAAKKASGAVGYAARKFMNLFSGVKFSSENEG